MAERKRMERLTVEQCKLIEDNIMLKYACYHKLTKKYPLVYKEAIADCCTDAIVNSARLYNEKNGEFSTLVYTAASNNLIKYITYVKAQKRTGVTISFDSENKDDKEFSEYSKFGKEDNYQFIDLKDCFDILNERDKDMIYRYYIYGETSEEIGADYGCSPRMVRHFINKAFKKMKVHLEG